MVDEQSLSIITYNKNTLNNLRRAIVLGQGQRSLMIVRVNYRRLRRLLLSELNNHLRLNSVHLPPTATGLREAILAGAPTSRPIDQVQALMVHGLEDVHQIERFLRTANGDCDELIRLFRYPIILWVNDVALQQLNRYAHDLTRLAATPIRFEYPVRSLVSHIKTQAHDTFTQILETHQCIVSSHHLPLITHSSEPFDNQEISFAIDQLNLLSKETEPSSFGELLADFLFLQGRNLHQQGDLVHARSCYEHALTYWQQHLLDYPPEPLPDHPPEPLPDNGSHRQTDHSIHALTPFDKQAVLLFHLGLGWCTHALSSSNTYTQDCLKAQHYFEDCLAIFRQQNRADYVSHFILALADILQKLENWPALSDLANEGVVLHHDDPARLACDYGYLAEIALARYQAHPHPDHLSKAQSLVEQALDASAQALSPTHSTTTDSPPTLSSTEQTAPPTTDATDSLDLDLASFEKLNPDLLSLDLLSLDQLSLLEQDPLTTSLETTSLEDTINHHAQDDKSENEQFEDERLEDKQLENEQLEEQEEKTLDEDPEHPVENSKDNLLARSIALRHHRGYYLYLLARMQELKGHAEDAIAQLEIAQSHSDPHYDLSLYRRILDRLWHLYFGRQHYTQAFKVKLTQRRIEHLFGLRAFIGASPMNPSVEHILPYRPPCELAVVQFEQPLAIHSQCLGRLQDTEALISRLSQPYPPIIVMHGQAGVGKSSILNAGLVPRLRGRISEGRTTVPLMISRYSDWASQIQIALTAHDHPSQPSNTPCHEKDYEKGDPQGHSHQGHSNTEVSTEVSTGAIASQSLLNQIKTLTQSRYLKIIFIFDQFEDFFRQYPTIEQRQTFYTFLQNCLTLPYVKVLLSLREDFLYHLLEWDRNADLSMIENDILGKEIRYYLSNFRPKASELLIRQLTQSVGFNLEDKLITALVDDLIEETGEVRSLELQVVGAQLQRENIKTLAAYQALGQSPKSKLLTNFLDSVIQDCGPENSAIAQSVLDCLSNSTSNSTRRILKSYCELEKTLAFAQASHEGKGSIDEVSSRLSLVLDIFVKSGLVFAVPDVSGVRYQLVHTSLRNWVQQPSPIHSIREGQPERSPELLPEPKIEDPVPTSLATQSEALPPRRP